MSIWNGLLACLFCVGALLYHDLNPILIGGEVPSPLFVVGAITACLSVLTSLVGLHHRAVLRELNKNWSWIAVVPPLFFVLMGVILSDFPTWFHNYILIYLMISVTLLLLPASFSGLFYDLGQEWDSHLLAHRAKISGILALATLGLLVLFWNDTSAYIVKSGPDGSPLWLRLKIIIPLTLGIFGLAFTVQAARIVLKLVGNLDPEIGANWEKREESSGSLTRRSQYAIFGIVLTCSVAMGILSRHMMGYFLLGFIPTLFLVLHMLSWHLDRVHHLWLDQGDHAKAIRSYRIWRYILDPRDYFVTLGGIYIHCHQLDKFHELLRKQKKMGYREEILVGFAALAARDWDVAEHHLRRSVELTPAEDRAAIMMDLIAHLARRCPEKIDEAFALWEEAITLKINPVLEPTLIWKEALLWVAVGEVDLVKQILDENIPILESVAQENARFKPTLADAYLQYGKAYALEGQPKEALTYYQLAMKTDLSPTISQEVRIQIEKLEKGESLERIDEEKLSSRIVERRENFEVLKEWPGGFL